MLPNLSQSSPVGNVSFNQSIHKNEITLIVPDYDDLDYFRIGDDVAVVRTSVEPLSGERASLKYKGVYYFGKYEREDLLNLIVLELPTGKLIFADTNEVSEVCKVIGICRKDNDYRFTPIN